MKGLIIVLCCLVASTLAIPNSRKARATDLPTPTSCFAPNCDDPRLINGFFPNIDPNYYWACNSIGGGWEPEKRPCQCESLFDFNSQSCIPYQQWQPQCPGQPINPNINACAETPSMF